MNDKTSAPLDRLTEAQLLLRRCTLLAGLLAILPTLAIHGNYLIAAYEGSVPWCNPYWDSCTSISATGRHGIAYYVFKATMMPMALLYACYWFSCNRYLNLRGYKKRHIAHLGSIAVTALLVYVIALGAVGDGFQLSRRIGIIFYFTLTYLCQLLIASQLARLPRHSGFSFAQQSLLATILLIGLLTLLLDAVLSDYDAIEDAFEWLVALLLHLNFLLAALNWHALPAETPGNSLDVNQSPPSGND